jgi:hypothetical protein
LHWVFQPGLFFCRIRWETMCSVMFGKAVFKISGITLLIAPFLVFFPSRAWLYLQTAVVFTFPISAVEFDTGAFREISWLKLFEYVPFYGLLLYGLFRGGFLFRDKSYAKPRCIPFLISSLILTAEKIIISSFPVGCTGPLFRKGGSRPLSLRRPCLLK